MLRKYDILPVKRIANRENRKYLPPFMTTKKYQRIYLTERKKRKVNQELLLI